MPFVVPVALINPDRIVAVAFNNADWTDPTPVIVDGTAVAAVSATGLLVVPVPDTREPPMIEVAITDIPFITPDLDTADAAIVAVEVIVTLLVVPRLEIKAGVAIAIRFKVGARIEPVAVITLGTAVILASPIALCVVPVAVMREPEIIAVAVMTGPFVAAVPETNPLVIVTAELITGKKTDPVLLIVVGIIFAVA